MKKRTYRNVHKAVQIVMAKGYSHEEANNIVIRVFDDYEMWNNGMPVEWYLDKIIPKEQYEAQRKEAQYA